MFPLASMHPFLKNFSLRWRCHKNQLFRLHALWTGRGERQAILQTLSLPHFDAAQAHSTYVAIVLRCRLQLGGSFESQNGLSFVANEISPSGGFASGQSQGRGVGVAQAGRSREARGMRKWTIPAWPGGGERNADDWACEMKEVMCSALRAAGPCPSAARSLGASSYAIWLID
ncbi:hypothetical protein BDZ91DRAFT_765795 [Kalaharituber pfeilii]|nr:hypothetical protein BDZ91DRAFT_765795 [Kalaharituber pfeilii]